MDTTTNKKWNKFDTAWVLNLFGTAVGAGVLFLPINAGMGGFWPLVVMAILVGPMTYFAHRGLAYFVLSSSKPGSDITEVVEEHFGPTAGKLITLLYFFAIFPILINLWKRDHQYGRFFYRQPIRHGFTKPCDSFFCINCDIDFSHVVQ